MSDTKSPSWWHTVPGMLTGAAAVITAVSGLMLALSQAGWLGGNDQDSEAGTQTVAETLSPPQQQPQASKSSTASTAPGLTTALPQVVIGYDEFTFLDVATERRTADQFFASWWMACRVRRSVT